MELEVDRLTFFQVFKKIIRDPDFTLKVLTLASTFKLNIYLHICFIELTEQHESKIGFQKHSIPHHLYRSHLNLNYC